MDGRKLKSLKRKEELVGKVYKTKHCGDVVIVDYDTASRVTVKFLTSGTLKQTKLCHVESGSVKDTTQPSVFGVGFLGDEKGFLNGDATPIYRTWNRLMERCYSQQRKNRNKHYEQCTSSENFKNFTFFKKWCEKQVGSDQEGWHLDKDILVKGNKIYSEDTCCFVPLEINNLFTLSGAKRGSYLIGVSYCNGSFVARMKNVHIGTFKTELEAFYAYKAAKEAKVKKIANKWKDKIDKRVYDTLMNYQVEITD